MSTIRGASIVCSFVLLASPALAAEYFVAPGGSDKASGKAVAPWKTLQKAAESVKGGDKVTVEDGEYRGFLLHDQQFGPKRVVFVARNKWKARITRPGPGHGENDGISIVASSYVTIDGFEVTRQPRAGIVVRSFDPSDTGADTRDNIIQNCWTHGNGGTNEGGGAHDGILTGWAMNVTIQGNLVEKNAEHGIYVSNSADNPIIRNNIVRRNYAQGIQINGDGDLDGDGVIKNWEISGNTIYENSLQGGSTAVNLDGAVGGRMFNNLIYDNGKGGIVLWQGNGSQPSNDNVIYNNTVYNPKGGKAAFILYTGAANNVIFNNIFYSKNGGIEDDKYEAGQNNRHDHNLVKSILGKTKLGKNEASPPVETIFVDPAKGDFHLKAGSPAVDKGTLTFAGRKINAPDLEGRPRTASAPDIGCFELSPGGSAPAARPPSAP
jgi:parallel beta-helix repeat protein